MRRRLRMWKIKSLLKNEEVSRAMLREDLAREIERGRANSLTTNRKVDRDRASALLQEIRMSRSRTESLTQELQGLKAR